MSVKIGFAILSYNEPEQLLRLVNTLNAMFGDPPIVCHHDFSKCSLDETLFPSNVRFVHPHIVTERGLISVPLALLEAFRLLREHDQLDWYVPLSGCDYPVRPADEIIAEFTNTKFDAYLDYREILYSAIPPAEKDQHGGFDRPSWVPLAYDRYCACLFYWWPVFSKKKLFALRIPLDRRRVVLFRNPRITRWFQSNRPSRIFGGDFAFLANHRAIDRLLDPSVEKLIPYFQAREAPDEALFHTVLCNHADLQICKDTKRYADWSIVDPHPKWLEVSDVPKILASGALFARKFRPDGVAQEFIDRTVLGLVPDRETALR
ncbi:MAG: beta-1,6-N-acetylglucosaminyltransferase [Candidatus Acidiferrales bacterium]